MTAETRRINALPIVSMLGLIVFTTIFGFATAALQTLPLRPPSTGLIEMGRPIREPATPVRTGRIGSPEAEAPIESEAARAITVALRLAAPDAQPAPLGVQASVTPVVEVAPDPVMVKQRKAKSPKSAWKGGGYERGWPGKAHSGRVAKEENGGSSEKSDKKGSSKKGSR